ncbi:MAG: hypothetical protein EZS28_047103, partial [Streblomastix strix]
QRPLGAYVIAMSDTAIMDKMRIINLLF